MYVCLCMYPINPHIVTCHYIQKIMDLGPSETAKLPRLYIDMSLYPDLGCVIRFIIYIKNVHALEMARGT